MANYWPYQHGFDDKKGVLQSNRRIASTIATATTISVTLIMSMPVQQAFAKATIISLAHPSGSDATAARQQRVSATDVDAKTPVARCSHDYGTSTCNRNLSMAKTY